MNDLKQWLEGLGLGQYERVLIENDVDFDILPQLSDADLKDLGFSLGHRRRLLSALRDKAASPAPAPALAERPDVEEQAERRQLTVLFCDLVGSTELSQRLDPERLREIMGRYHDAVAGAVVASEGHVAKFLGDGVLAYFGWPRAHEDQAESAIRAALAAVAAVEGIDADGAALAARAGIATGPVVIGDMVGVSAREQGSVVGSTPNLAARLQDLARPGEVVIDRATRRLIGRAFELEDAGAQQVKGFNDQIEVWRVRGTARVDSRFDALHEIGLSEFVGRRHELGLLLDRWHQARDGEGQVVLIFGEAGIGKSRILREVTTQLMADEPCKLRFQCSPHEINAAFQPVISEIESAAGFLPDDTPEQRLGKLEQHLAGIFEAGNEALALIAGLLGLPLTHYGPIEMAPQRRKQRTIVALCTRIAELSRIRPVVLLVEDTHWIDPSSLEWLDALVAQLQDLPVLAVMTFRPEFAPRWDGQGHVTVLSLNRLGSGDGRAIAERVAGNKALPESVLDRIIEQTDGIPLFVEELTKAVLEAGIVEERDGRYELTGSLPLLAIPTTLQDSLMARLDRLAPVKRVIQAAACIGREFDAGLLAVALQMDEAELDAALEQLLGAQLVFRRSAADSAARYVFKHALVQDAAYASLLTSTRRSLHQRLAFALEQTENPDPLALARHFFEAGAQARAAAFYLMAGRQLLGSSALPEAIGALELGLQALEAIARNAERDRIELDVRVALGTARMARFGWAHPSVSEALEPAFALAMSFDDRDALGSILWGLWVHYQTRTDFPRAHEWLSRLESLATENADSDLPVIYEMSAGCQYFWEAAYQRAVGHTDRLKQIYDREQHARLVALTNHDPLVFAQHWAGSLADWIRGYPDRSVERMDEAVSLARRIGHPFNLVFALTAGASSLIYLDETKRLLDNCDEAERVVDTEALGPFSEHVLVMQWRGGAHVLTGAFDLGYSLARKGNDFWNGNGGRICNAMFRSWIVRGLQGLGRFDKAIELNWRNIAHCRETGDRYMEPECVRLQGELMLAINPADTGSAERLFRDATELAQAHGARSWELRAAMSLAGLLASRDHRTEAVACLEPILNGFTEGLETADLRQARDMLATMG
jgi:class 3 adenylate cyclase